MKDIVPDLFEKIRQSFHKNLQENRKTEKLLEVLAKGAATYVDAGEYAYEIGESLAKAFFANLSSAVLPNGKMYWNIAERVIEPFLEKDYNEVNKFALQVQDALNRAVGLNLKAQSVPFDKDKAKGIMNKVCAADTYDDVAWVLDSPIKNFSQAVVDETIRANVEFQGKSGLRPKIIRTAGSKCCKWCSELEGVYTYPDVPKDVYRRHENCRCVVEYDPGSGRRQDAHTKQWQTAEENDKIKARKKIGLKTDRSPESVEERKKIGLYGLTDTDKAALNMYKSFESYMLNEALREGYDLTREQEIFMRNLERALDKLPKYEGVTYRSIDVSRIKDINAFWEKYQVGAWVEEKAYVSTSAKVYDDSFEIQMIIKGRNGRDLRGYTDLEDEILYPRNTRFLIVKQEENTLWMEEV